MFEPTSAEVVALAVTLPTLALTAVTLRITVKRKVRAFGADDFFICFSMCILLLISVSGIVGTTHYGFGKVTNGGNTDDGPLIKDTKKITDLINLSGPLCIGCAKISVLLFYRRIFRGNVFNIMSWIMIGLATSWALSFFLVMLFQCGRHISFLWSSGANIEEFCIPGFQISITCSATDAFTDLLIILLPIYWVLKLRMSRSKKIIVCGTFLVGALAFFSSVGRTISYAFIYPNHNNEANQLGYFTGVMYFITLEASLSVIAACLPTLAPLVHSKSFGALTGSGRKYNPSSFASIIGKRLTRKKSATMEGTETSSSDYIMRNDEQYYKLETLVSTGRPAQSDVERVGKITVKTDTDYQVKDAGSVHA